MRDDSIATWMARRQREVDDLAGPADARGRAAWAASTLSGQNLVAERPGDVRALGADESGEDAVVFLNMGDRPKKAVIRGGKAKLSDGEVAAIVFNETRSLSGPGIDEARKRIAHAVINGDETSGERRPVSSPTKATVPPAEAGAYQAAVGAVAAARAERANGVDPTNGALHFNFRAGASQAPFMGNAIRTQSGPFTNSYPTKDLPASGVYSNTYDD